MPLSSSLLVKAGVSHVSASGVKSAVASKWPFLVLFLVRIVGPSPASEKDFPRRGGNWCGIPRAPSCHWLCSLGNTNLGGWYDVTWLTFLVIGGGLVGSRIAGERQSLGRLSVMLIGLVAFLVLVMPRDLIRLRLQQGESGESRYWEDLADAGRRIRI